MQKHQLNYYDISPALSAKLGVFPGDVAFSRDISMDFKKGQHLLLSSIQTTLHIGAHADASNHYHADGEGVDQRPLTPYLGDCQVIAVKNCRGRRLVPADLKEHLSLKSRILFKTDSFPNPEKWNSDFSSLSPELIRFLHSKGVILVGIDTPSVDPEDSKGLESHQEIFKSKMCILEGIDLRQVPEGNYTLIALPLRIKDADASPVRAILIEKTGIFDSHLSQR